MLRFCPKIDTRVSNVVTVTDQILPHMLVTQQPEPPEPPEPVSSRPPRSSLPSISLPLRPLLSRSSVRPVCLRVLLHVDNFSPTCTVFPQKVVPDLNCGLHLVRLADFLGGFSKILRLLEVVFGLEKMITKYNRLSP